LIARLPSARDGLQPGEIVLRDATRSFSVRADSARTLKGLVLGRRVAGPAAVPALQGVNLHIGPGETVGMVGRNGAGKTSTLRVLAGIVPLQSGYAACGGRIVSLLELAAGFSRDFSGRENIYLQGALYGMGKAEVQARIERIIAFSELGQFIDIPVKAYSSGMFVRLGFSIAAYLDADVLLIDEVLAVGDEAFQRKCMQRISEQIAAGATVVLVSHNASAIERVCERVMVLEAGRVMFDGPTAEGLLFYHRLIGAEHGAGVLVRPHHERAVEVHEVQVLDGSDRPATLFRTGEPMRIVAVLRARVPTMRARLALEFRAGDGARLFRTTTEVDLDPTEVDLDPGGEASLTFELPALTLLAGEYDLALGAVKPGDAFSLDRTVVSRSCLRPIPRAWSTSAETGSRSDRAGGRTPGRGRGSQIMGSERVKDPAQALAAARRAAAATGEAEQPDTAPWSLEHAAVSARLAEWAIIEPEQAQVYSTRRFGAPITLFKQLLVRLLRQYLGQVSAQQSRFNAHIAAHVMALERRTAELEQARSQIAALEEAHHQAAGDEPRAR